MSSSMSLEAKFLDIKVTSGKSLFGTSSRNAYLTFGEVERNSKKALLTNFKVKFFGAKNTAIHNN